MPGLRPVLNIGFSGDGSEIWFGGAPVGRMRIMPMMGGPPRPFLVDRAVEVVWSSDGARMVYHTDAPGDPMFVADRIGAGARQLLSMRASEDTTIIRPGRRMVNGSTLRAASRALGNWICGGSSQWRHNRSGSPSQRVCGFPDTTRRPLLFLYIAQDRDGSGPWLWALDTNTPSDAACRVWDGEE